MDFRNINILLLCVIAFCQATKLDLRVKRLVVEDIINKVFNITSASLKSASMKHKDEILKKIESRLLLSAQPLGSKAHKYVQIIMQGLNILAANQSESLLQESDTQQPHDILRTYNYSLNSKDKNEAAKDIAKKILNLTKQHVHNAKTVEDKRRVMESIKKTVIDTANKQHDIIHDKHEKVKTYTNLISRGMELMMSKLENSKRRMIFEFVNKQNKRKNKEKIEEDFVEETQPNKFIDPEVEDISSQLNGDINFNDIEVSTANPRSYIVTTPISCKTLADKICLEVQTLNQYICVDSDQKNALTLNKLCDGVIDCVGGYDEEKCVDQALSKLHRAINIITQIETFLLRNCFHYEDGILMKQNIILNDVLQKQLKFISKYTQSHPNYDNSDNSEFKKTINEVATVINTLALALETSVCIGLKKLNSTDEIEVIGRKFMSLIDEDIDEISHKKPIPLKACACDGSLCLNKKCPEACKYVCWLNHTIGRMPCEAIDQDVNVPIDVLCDGKLDCYDEVDEFECNAGSSRSIFEANEIYIEILKMLKTKSTAAEYAPVKSKLLNLYNLVMQLQAVTVKVKVNVDNVRNTRDYCFFLLRSICQDLINQASTTKELADPEMFLLSINEKLVAALKRSNSGNEKILSPHGCYCRHGQCVLPRCSKQCQRSCEAQPKLTRYYCLGYDNISVSIDSICNGKPNCPNEDDEERCLKDVCRKHHLIVLRHTIRDAGDRHIGTALGETLKAWKTKVLATLTIAEKNIRPTPIIVREVITDMLQDLVTQYGSIEDNKRRSNSDYIFEEFYRLSQLIMENIRACGQ